MSVLIKDIEMPKNHNHVTITIWSDGTASYGLYNRGESLVGFKNVKAVPVPEHGDLIDRDALCEMLEKYKDEYALKAKEDIVHLHKAWGLHEAELMAESLPTIIPSDEVV